jgi:hypothetical protein
MIDLRVSSATADQTFPVKWQGFVMMVNEGLNRSSHNGGHCTIILR